MTEALPYKKKDFISSQEVRWCPGCGDYAILSSLQMALTKIGKRKEDIVFVSGIGCSSRFPYYMDTFGMHTIHGRAPGLASGVKLANPDLEVWVITGDGDGLSIGGNHLIHALRRNININIVLFNNEIYGLTKGQYSPTSKKGTISKSSPYGSVDRCFNPASLALGSGSGFYARIIDTDPKQMMETFVAASQYEGCSMIEVFQNCVIFNDKTHDEYTNRLTRDDTSVRVEHGKPLIFGKQKNKGIRLNGFKPEIVTIGENGITEKDLIVHDETDEVWANILAHFKRPHLPISLGILHRLPEPTYDKQMMDQIDEITKKKGPGVMQDLLLSGEVWEVK